MPDKPAETQSEDDPEKRLYGIFRKALADDRAEREAARKEAEAKEQAKAAEEAARKKRDPLGALLKPKKG